MKAALAILVLAYSACLSEATLKHLKAKLKLSPLVQPAGRHKYVATSVVLPETVPLVYSSPISTFSSHAPTYSTVPHYAPSYPATYSVPIAYSPTVAVPVPIYKKPLAYYEEPTVIHYEEPATLFLEASAFDTEGHYSTYNEIWDK